MINKKTITDFGFPDILKSLEPQFYFDDSVSKEHSATSGCHVDPRSVKFHIHSSLTNESIFIMEFYIRSGSNRIDAFRNLSINKPHIRLQYIGTNPKYMNKGISKYYLHKLHDFSVNNNFDTITINIAPSGKGGMDEKQLFDFYNSFNSDKVKIVTF